MKINDYMWQEQPYTADDFKSGKVTSDIKKLSGINDTNKTAPTNLHNGFYVANFGVTKAEFDEKAAEELIHQPGKVWVLPPTTSNNIDTAVGFEKGKVYLLEFLRDAITFEQVDSVLESLNVAGITAYAYVTRIPNAARVVGDISEELKADRDKLIKHLAFEMGENYEAMMKIANTLK